uniref:Myosin XVB n=1 Tax=Varanus komodoensis TaxID=61221 RepID=A0A8D2Q651_VARKO
SDMETLSISTCGTLAPVLLRFIHDKELQDWQKMLLGNYIVRHGLASHSLRNELLSQVATQVWKNPDLQQSQQGWVLMAALLSTFAPSPYLGKPLLKFVSDHGLEGYNGICQRKLLMSMKLVDSDAEASRSFPPTQLEWIANQRKGKMVLDVYTYQEEKFSAEVESWTTGEQYAGWILNLIGCDFVLDLIGGREASNWPSQSLPDYPITPEHDGGYVQQSSVERSVALLLAPCPLQPPFLPRSPHFSPSPSFSPSAMVVPQPQPMLPSVDPSQVAVQQQAFINQQALLMVRGKGFKTVMGNFQGSQDHPYSLKRPPAGCTCLLVAQKFDLIKGGHLSSGSAVLPSPPPPPGKLSSTIKEKQLPLMGLFSRPQTTLSSTSELPPPPPPPPPPVPPPMPPSFPSDSARTMVDDSNIKTQLFSISPSVTFSYANPTWKLFLRKEVFYPKELFSHPYCLNLLCDQIIRDTYSDSCIRLSKEERRKMKDLLGKQAVGMNVRSISEDGIKKRIVLAARDNWANYFSRLFPVKGENGSDIQLLGVSHRGLQLLKRAKVAPFSPEHLKTLCSYSYADVLSLELLGWNVLQLSLKDEQLILHSHKAWQIKAMVEQFLHELKQDSKYVIALRSYVTDDKSLLSFKKGNFIRVLPMEGLEPGWQFGSIGGRSGLFPSALVQFAAVPEHLSLHLNQQEEGRKSLTRGKEETVPGKEVRQTMIPQSLTGRRFRETCGERRLWGGSTGRVTFFLTWPSGINASSCIAALMRFMGDQPNLKKQEKMEYGYEILQVCSFFSDGYVSDGGRIRSESCYHGWLLLNLLTGYFSPSNHLMPYVTKYLQQASSDGSSPFTGTVRLPSLWPCFGITERDSSEGPGGMAEHLWVAAEVVKEIGENIGVVEPEELQEFAILACKDKGKLAWPMRQKEYIHDYLLGGNLIELNFRRITWKTPLHFENEIYINIHYNQVKRVTELPLSGYNTYPLEKTSIPDIPRPCYVGVNQKEIVVMDGNSQKCYFRILLKTILKMRTVRPISKASMPGLELYYGPAEDPKMILFELKQRGGGGGGGIIIIIIITTTTIISSSSSYIKCP